MNTEIQNALKEAIEKSLPSLQANQLKEFFTKYEKLEMRIKELEEAIEPKNKEIAELKSSLSNRILTIQGKDETLAQNKKKIEEQEALIVKISSELRDFKVTAEQSKTEMMYNLVSMVFKVPEKVSSFSSNNPMKLNSKSFDYNSGRTMTDYDFIQDAPLHTTTVEKTN